uniref:Uncharacterized protein n=1 Tax=Tectiviridae sp. TaxID=2831614 RepID=A0A8S5VYD1_9VIRU|nr:MAG TPA: hypothetical protein [Tectiviridae sp.]
MPKKSEAEKKRQVKLRNKLARQANKQKRELEKAGINYGASKKYKEAVKGIYNSNHRKRFRESGGYDNNVPREIRKLNEFLSYKTSSVLGVQHQVAKQMETLEERYGIEFQSVEEYNDFIEFMTSNEYGKIMGSDRVIQLYKSEFSKDEIRQAFEAYKGQSPQNFDDVAKRLGFDTGGDLDMYLYRGKGKKPRKYKKRKRK